MSRENSIRADIDPVDSPRRHWSCSILAKSCVNSLVARPTWTPTRFGVLPTHVRQDSAKGLEHGFPRFSIGSHSSLIRNFDTKLLSIDPAAYCFAHQLVGAHASSAVNPTSVLDASSTPVVPRPCDS